MEKNIKVKEILETFCFKTVTTMKPYNRSKWWIDGDIIPEAYVYADNLKEALTKYQKLAEEYGITISKSALKSPEPMYIDSNGMPKQTGLVITGSMDFYDENNHRSRQFIYLWVEIFKKLEVSF